MLRLNPGSTTLSTFFSSPLLSPGIGTLVFPTVENLHVFQPESNRQGLESQVLLLRIPQIFNHHQMSHEIPLNPIKSPQNPHKIPMKSHENPKQITKLSRSHTGTATPLRRLDGIHEKPRSPPDNGRGQRCRLQRSSRRVTLLSFHVSIHRAAMWEIPFKDSKLFTPY